MSDEPNMKLPKYRTTAMTAWAVGALMSAGCVTINIYFPAAAAEKAADRIIDEVWQLKGGAPAPAAPAAGHQACCEIRSIP